jgi:hypothetical protein
MAKILELGLLSFSLLGEIWLGNGGAWLFRRCIHRRFLSLSLSLLSLQISIGFIFFFFSFLFLWFLTVKRSSGGFFFFWGFLTTVVVGGCGCCSGGGWSVSLSSPVVCSSGVSSFDFLTF